MSIFTIKTEGQLCYLALWNLLIFVLSLLFIRSDIGKSGLSAKTLRHIQRTWGYLIVADHFYQIFCNKKIDHLPTKSATEDVKLLEEHRKDYVIP